ncbi:MAG: phosphomannomutase/phosphoglucomutase [Candidatus Staskawiczbacteria bacterium]|nr:phosphomannomutase/phosphoglucomutase [Candidatus Staskawiczbacteria bacterium]MBI3337153.1 phosphomannomutase/phosphoglucomutase [Candidatus Staskawiczbacteria bacterium]
MIDPTIFKSYDIRGIYPNQLNEETAYKIGRSFVKYTGAKSVIIGQDARISSPALFDSLVKGITTEGANVYNLGQVPTECLYFGLGSSGFNAGIMITASHNPKEYNGFKMLKKNGNDMEIIRGKDLLSAIQDGNFNDNIAKGSIARKDIWQDYEKHILSFANLNEIKHFKIAIDASNGVGGLAVAKIGDKLPVKIFLLNYEPDGDFPNHSPNPLLPGSTDQIKAEIEKESADFGFIFDGDADRIFLVDENGWLVRADVTLLLLAKYFLQKNPGSAIAYNAICSKAVPEFIKKWRGVPVKTKVGFVNVREGLLKNNGVMGGELSGHYCFRDNYYLDSGVLAFLILLQIISRDHKKVSEIVQELSPYAKSSEINFEIMNREEIIEKIKEKYKDAKQDYLDGITVEHNNWWFNARSSETEPLLRITIEADTKDLLEEKQKELRALVEAK